MYSERGEAPGSDIDEQVGGADGSDSSDEMQPQRIPTQSDTNILTTENIPLSTQAILHT